MMTETQEPSHLRNMNAAERAAFEEMMTKPNVQCAYCTDELRPESALMHEGKPFCDEFCRNAYIKEQREKIPLAAGLHRDGTLIVKVDESMRTMVAGKAR